jgi:glycine cleavage system H lipoate-binding protein
VNSNPYDKGWMIKLKPDNPADAGKLLSADDYLKKSGGH